MRDNYHSEVFSGVTTLKTPAKFAGKHLLEAATQGVL